MKAQTRKKTKRAKFFAICGENALQNIASICCGRSPVKRAAAPLGFRAALSGTKVIPQQSPQFNDGSDNIFCAYEKQNSRAPLAQRFSPREQMQGGRKRRRAKKQNAQNFSQPAEKMRYKISPQFAVAVRQSSGRRRRSDSAPLYRAQKPFRSNRRSSTARRQYLLRIRKTKFPRAFGAKV